MTTIMEKAGDAAARIGELPPIPAVILEAMRLLNDPTSTVKKIQEQILLDQALTAFILKLANSALFGLRKEVVTVSYAINLMGYNTARSILIAYLSKNLYSARGNKPIQAMLWKHSLSSAVFGRKIAGHLEKVDPEEAFISSLLHDIGKGVLLKNRTGNFEEIVRMIYIENMSSIEAEGRVLGFTHVEAGYVLMKNWRFSDTIVETVTYHHNIQEYRGDNLLVPIVSLANKMSHLHNYTFDKREEELSELDILGIPGADMEEMSKPAIEQIENYLEIF
jgi:putative nucleotidyltransferase with HDIG domain